MKNVMLDLETMGSSPGSAILSIGAVVFDPKGVETRAYDEFHVHIDLVDSINHFFRIEGPTVLWWMNQSDEARSGVTRGQVAAQPIQLALLHFSDWLLHDSNKEDIVMWGNGASFDNVLLQEAYRIMKLALPWKYSNDRCYRTIKNERPDVQLVRKGTHHNALDDAMSQAFHLQAIYKVQQQQG